MTNSNKFSHLTLSERRIILTGITNSSTKTAIAATIGKDKSTVGKEIKCHRILTHKCKFPLECNNYKKCPYGLNCTLGCHNYSPFSCYRCRFNKYQYFPEKAQSHCESTLVDAREGVNLTYDEAKSIVDTIILY